MKILANYSKKIQTYIGFATKANKVVYGVDNIVKVKNIHIILYSNLLGQNSLEKLTKYANEVGVYMQCIDNFNEFVKSENCKAIAIKEKHLADAISENLNKNSIIEGE